MIDPRTASPAAASWWAAPAARLWSEVAARRRRWYAGHPARQRTLRRPVVSVGNLAAGGSGKTPLVERIAAALRDRGERPAVLTRGYAREDEADGVVIVRDRDHILADVSRAGDEPLMLARRLDGVAVLVSPDRYLAGRLAETRLGCTVHVLDDGFQHVQLARDVDLLVASGDDLERGAVIPLGRLRERADAARRADAWIATGVSAEDCRRIASALGLQRTFRATRAPGEPALLAPSGPADAGAVVPRDARVLAVAGVARPERFFDDVRAAGFNIVGAIAWRDHHRVTGRDVRHIADAGRAARADIVMTTEKDLARWLRWRPLPFPLASMPIAVEVAPVAAGPRDRGLSRSGAEPPDTLDPRIEMPANRHVTDESTGTGFIDWLVRRIAVAREVRRTARPVSGPAAADGVERGVLARGSGSP